MDQESLNKGFGILEIVIASAIIGSVLFAMVSVFILSKDAVVFSRQKLQASLLAEEGIEVTKFMRDLSWNANINPLLADTKYYFIFSSSTSQWLITATPGPKIDGIFERSFYAKNVSRDASANIETIYNLSNDDPGTRKIIMTIEWTHKGKNNSVEIETYLTNLFGN